MELNTVQEIGDLVLGAVSENYAMPRETLTRETKLDDLGDSLDRVEFAMAVEDDADIELPDSKISEFVTIEDAVRYVCTYKGIRYEEYVPNEAEAKRNAIHRLLNAAVTHENSGAAWRTSITDLLTLLHMDTSYAERQRIAQIGGFVSGLTNENSDNARAMEMNLFVHGYIVRCMIAAGYNANTQLPLVAPAIVPGL